ncbi:hypothetical protein ABB37_06015 [Leptomonas pyrrhocoris]|uniref:Transmembrane protein n=1 Tax=Leptomonas pyrrhocoris TaxID=157538 RepID=A0A0N1J4Q4_LEPPY|nr:hypothetical protein ABB37_06015 [Leptomonas pyrrhocoris]KPA78951.1 hypothetical protein ABB37_06015 [Leptomonas pyrrhocoris]|eukprot:XP_015657390.1 hypothetical protein ABB37_06015 [Leptomonas pyrrhocoris]
MPPPTSPPRLAGAALLVALLVCSFLLVVPSPAASRVEVKGSREYESVKEDFLCRACVGLGEVFFDEVLPPLADRYRLSTVATSGGSSSSSPPSSAPPRAAPKASHRQREQMIVEVHDAIDALCDALEKSIQRQSVAAAATVAANDAAAQQLLNPLVSSKDLHDGVIIACPMALEEMNEALTDTAFKHLLPGEGKHAPSSNTKEQEKAHDVSSKKPGSTPPAYRLPAAGTFCEEVGLCSPYVHYHITSDADVRRRAREAQEAASIRLDASDPPPTTRDNSGKQKKSTTGPKAAQRNPPNQKEAPPKKSTSNEGPSGEDESLMATLHRVFQRETWRQLKNSLNTTEVLSVGFWLRGLSLMADSDVRFHVQAYVPFVVVYSVCLAAVLLVVLAAVFLCHRPRPSLRAVKAGPHATDRPPSNSGHLKKHQ